MQLPRKMSAHNVMASISRTLGNRESKPAVGNEIRFAGEERKDKLYEPKHKQKLIRVLTVVAYVIFVSMAAILLSLYYTFLWDPKDLAVKVPRPSKLECDASKLTSSFTAPTITNETQIEIMTVKPSVTSIVGQLGKSEKKSNTTERQDMLAILTRLAKTNTTPSTLLTPTTFKDDVAELATTLENSNNTVPA